MARGPSPARPLFHLLIVALVLVIPSLPAADPPANTVHGDDAILLEETLEIDVASASSARVRYTNRTQVLTQRGAERNDVAAVDWRPGLVVRSLQGAVTSPGGKRAEVKKQMIADRAAFASFELYSDSMIRTISFPGVVPGSIVEYSWEQEVTNLQYLPKRFDLQEPIPARMKTLVVRSPTSFPVRLGVRGDLRPEESAVNEGGVSVRTFTVRDVAPLRREDDMPPMDDLVPHITIRPGEIVWSGRHIDASAWTGIGRFYWDIARDRMAPAPEVAEAAKSLTASLANPDARLRAVYEFVQGKINYVSISLDIGGWQPHPNADVLKYRYGDCKDKATLMVAMVRSLGQVAYPVLIRTRDIGLQDLDSPGLAFNHAIVAVPRSEGGYLFLDPTAEEAPFGDLPWVDQGVPVVVVRDDGSSEVVETPLLAPERNRRQHSVTASIRPDGTLAGTYVIESWGQRRQQRWGLLQSRASDREDELEDLVAWLSPGAVMKDHKVTAPAGPDDPLRIEMSFEIPHYLTQAGAFQVVSPHVVRFPAITRMAAYPSRLHPVFFPFLMDERVEVRLALPPGRTLRKVPSDRTLDGPGVSGRTRYEMAREGDRQVLVVHRSLTVSRREIPASDYPALRTFIASLAEEEAGASTIVPAT